jgi:Ca2+:H+ antiporter
MPVRAVDDKPSDTLVVVSGEGFWTGSSTLPHLHQRPACARLRLDARRSACDDSRVTLAEIPRLLGRIVLMTAGVAGVAGVLSFVLHIAGAPSVLVFGISAVALAALAVLIGQGTDQLGHRFGPGATGILQSALGNLPELFISIFALRAGLVVVVQTALIGSILANTLLVLGLAFLLGGLRHGTQRFEAPAVRTMATLLLLAVAALAIPTLATAPGEPDAGHEIDLSVITSIVLLVVFAASIPFSLRGGPGASAGVEEGAGEAWPLPVAIGVLSAGAIGAALTSDLFVESLKPTMADLGLSEAFVGLVIVAIAGNAVENLVGVRAAAANKMDLATSLILNSSLQVAIALTPALVLISLFLGGGALTLVLSPLLLGAVVLAAILAAVIVFDGESTWLEGLALLGLYIIIAASVWYGPPIRI